MIVPESNPSSHKTHEMLRLTPETGAHQLVLDMFSKAIAENKGITEVEKDVGFNKSSVLIDMTDLSRLGRQFINAALFLCDNGTDAQDKDIKLFQWLMDYQSRNTAHLKRVAREAQKCAIQVQIYDSNNPEKDTWISVPLLGAVGISGGRIVYEVPLHIRNQLKVPDRRNYLSMRISASFSTQYALELYEKLLPFLDKEFSPWMPVDKFAEWIKVSNLKTVKDFRYLRRGVIVPAIEQINEITDILVELETKSKPGSKKITEIRFSIQKNTVGRLSPYNPTRFDQVAIFKTLRNEFALSDKEMSEIIENRQTFTDERIQTAIEFTRHRVNQAKGTAKEIKFPGLYLMGALRGNYRLANVDPSTQQKDVSEQRKVAEEQRDRRNRAAESVAENKIKQAVNVGFTWFQQLDQEKQTEIWKVFARSLAGKALLKRFGLDNSDQSLVYNDSVKPVFGVFVEQRYKKEIAQGINGALIA